MAGDGKSKHDKTEQPTAKRRQKAREEGQVARSTELNSVAVLAATLAALAVTAPRLLDQCEQIMARGLAFTAEPELASLEGLGALTAWGLQAAVFAAAPVVLAAATAGIAASVLQGGFRFSPKALKPSYAKLNLFAGLKRMVAPSQAVELAKSLAKMSAIGLVAGLELWHRLPTLVSLVGLPPAALLVELAQLVFAIALRVVAALAVIAVLDLAWQRHKHNQTLKMTKEEVRKEAKESDVAPEVKGQIRRRQNEAARNRMLADVPTADVVVVNPTHYAVALRYDGKRPAPEVVAKGVDHLALTIRRLAEEAGVTVVHEAPLARALYREVELGQMIPEELFTAVAEILAFVFRTAGRRRRAIVA